MKLLTFLGTGRYEPTNYIWEATGKRKYTKIFPIALTEWLQPDEVVVFLTSEAEKHDNWSELKNAINAKPVDIDDGASEDGLWKIFAAIVENVKPGDRLIIDITHGFRSLPMLGLLVAAYLKSSKDVTVQHLVYGAYEARNKESNESPVFELTSFLNLFDWMVASKHFLDTGYGRPLANLLDKVDGTIGELRNGILELSDGLHLLRPMAVTRSASELEKRVRQASQEAAREIPPLAEMLCHISESYGRFAVQEGSPKQQLEAQLKMIDWYLERRQLAQALALAREWLPSLLCVFFGVDMLNTREREDMELLLAGGKVKDRHTGETIKESHRINSWDTVPAGKRMRTLWSGSINLAQLRNDVLHAGFREKPKKPEEIECTLHKVVGELKAIWAEIKDDIE